jgi:hypothetical protein
MVKKDLLIRHAKMASKLHLFFIMQIEAELRRLLCATTTLPGEDKPNPGRRRTNERGQTRKGTANPGAESL